MDSLFFLFLVIMYVILNIFNCYFTTTNKKKTKKHNTKKKRKKKKIDGTIFLFNDIML